MWEKTLRTISVVSQLVVIGGAILGAIGWASGLIDSTLDNVVTSRINKQLDTPDSKLAQLVNRTIAKSKSSERSFGDWQQVVVGETREAGTDGFLSAFSGGGNEHGTIARFSLQTGAGTVVSRSRGGQYEGATIPVKQGQNYMVNVTSGSRGTVTAYWLPFQREN